MKVDVPLYDFANINIHVLSAKDIKITQVVVKYQECSNMMSWNVWDIYCWIEGLIAAMYNTITYAIFATPSHDRQEWGGHFSNRVLAIVLALQARLQSVGLSWDPGGLTDWPLSP